MRGLVVQQVARYARNRELRIEINYSCNKLHATEGAGFLALHVLSGDFQMLI